MAQKRMFTMRIVDSDAFLDMPLSTQALYFHLCMRADDDGFIANPKRIGRLIGTSDDDLKLLYAKRFILAFENGVIVIKHWRMHNTIQKDRYIPTVYQEELATLSVKANKAYTDALIEQQPEHDSIAPMETSRIQNVSKPESLCNQNVSKVDTGRKQNDSAGLGLDIGLGLGIDKGLDKEKGLDKAIVDYVAVEPQPKPRRTAFRKPSVEDMIAYFIEKGSTRDEAEKCFDYYEANGWRVGKNPMKDWKAASRNWMKNDYGRRSGGNDRYSALRAWTNGGG